MRVVLFLPEDHPHNYLGGVVAGRVSLSKDRPGADSYGSASGPEYNLIYDAGSSRRIFGPNNNSLLCIILHLDNIYVLPTLLLLAANCSPTRRRFRFKINSTSVFTRVSFFPCFRHRVHVRGKNL